MPYTAACRSRFKWKQWVRDAVNAFEWILNGFIEFNTRSILATIHRFNENHHKNVYYRFHICTEYTGHTMEIWVSNTQHIAYSTYKAILQITELRNHFNSHMLWWLMDQEATNMSHSFGRYNSLQCDTKWVEIQVSSAKFKFCSKFL